jgi:N-acetylglucosamine kinase-like BadF-type ATPase
MNYLIGMDGGGTKTHCIITDGNGKLLHECSGGPSNFLMLGTETVSETLLQLITSCTEALNISFDDIDAVVIGTTGAGRRNDAEKLEHDFIKFASFHAAGFKKFRVESDARIALEGAFSGKPGSILIAGTGSIMFGKDVNDNIIRVGGYGRFLGDEGSGYVLGKRGLVAVSKEFDGRGEQTLISKLVSEKFNIVSPELLITEIYKNNFDIAAAAPLVIEAASEGDKIALRIVDEETDELVLHVSTMFKKINEKILNLALIGGLITHKNIYSDTFRNKVSNYLPDVNIKEPDQSPALGAVLMAKKLVKES